MRCTGLAIRGRPSRRDPPASAIADSTDIRWTCLCRSCPRPGSPCCQRASSNLDLRDDDIREPLRHLGTHDVGGHELPGLGLPVGVPKLYHGLDRLKLDQVAVSHLGSRALTLPGTCRQEVARPAQQSLDGQWRFGSHG